MFIRKSIYSWKARSIYSAILFSLIATPLLSAVQIKEKEQSLPPPPPPAYDADLYNRDIETCLLDAELLYWTVNEGALDYAQKMTQPAWSSTTPSYASGKVKSASYHLDPGLRVMVGFFNALKYWDVRGQYTHFICRGQNSTSRPSSPSEFLTGTWPQITTNPLTHAHSDIFFNYNVFHLLISRIFYPNLHLRLRMTGGASSAWIGQDWKMQYFDGGIDKNTTIRNRWHFVGGGLSTGLIADWYWGNHIYLTGSTMISLYMGSYSNRSKQTTTFQVDPSDNTSLPVRNSRLSNTRPALSTQFSIGPSWQQNFGPRRVEVFIGYELTGWFNLQEIRRSSSGAPSVAKETWTETSMLSLQGLTTRLTVDF